MIMGKRIPEKNFDKVASASENVPDKFLDLKNKYMAKSVKKIGIES